MTGRSPSGESAPPTVLKFGGTSVEDAAAFERVAEIVRAERRARPVVVVSAMSGVTDALLASVDAASAADLEPHLERHRLVARGLMDAAAAAGFEAELEGVREEIGRVLESVSQGGSTLPRLRDEVVSYGERLSSSLLAGVLTARDLPATWVDARRCIVTNDVAGRADPDFPETCARARAQLSPLLAAGRIPVLGGFIGASAAGVTTTLGRGGSDYSAALLGAALDAEEIQIWTDVSGVLTADPRVVRNAYTIPTLSYAEASELAYFGAKVLHPKSIQPALVRGIPVRIVNSRAPQDSGTVVAAEAELWPGTVKSIAHKTGITVLQITSARMLGAYGFLRTLFEVFDRHRMPVDVVTTSEVSLSLTVEGGAARRADRRTVGRGKRSRSRRPTVRQSDRPTAVELTRRLIDIPSVSGDEEAVARFLGGQLEQLGYGVEYLESAPGRPGLFASTDAAPRIVFCTHLDTVPPFFASSEDDEFVYGRGACDAKGIIAAQIAAAHRLRAEGIGELALLFVVDEEKGSIGARAANGHPAARQCRWLVVGEPTENKLATGSKGSLRVLLRTDGTGGHSAYPERGRSAIHTLLDVLEDVRAIAWPAAPEFGETTCNIGIIGGGAGANVIAPDARAELHIRR